MRIERFCITILMSLLSLSLLRYSVYADPALPLPFLPISGDQDDGSIIFQATGFDLLTDVKSFLVPGEGSVNVTYDLVFRGATFNNEFGFFSVDDDVDWKIGELKSGDSGYLQAALSRAKVIFPSGSTAFTADKSIEMNGGEVVVFFIIQDGTLTQFLNNNRFNEINKRPLAFFSIDSLNPDGIDHFVGFRNLSEEFTQFGFEDLTGGGDLDYDDITYNIQVVLRPSPTTEKRDIVFIRGLDSVGTCDGFNKWVKEYFAGEGKRLVGNSIENYYNFNYAGGGHYPCTDGEPSTTRYYEQIDTCDGIARAAGELRNLIDQTAQNKVTIVGWSMGGVVASFLVGSRFETDPEWVKQNIASVITFDSPHNGIPNAGALIKRLSPTSACRIQWEDLIANQEYKMSIAELVATSSIMSVAHNAAVIADGVIPFYTIDARADDIPTIGEFVPREWVNLTNARPFFVSNWCGDPSAPVGCEPPRGVNDNHDTVWSIPTTMDGLKKGPLVACAVMAPDWGCDFMAFALIQNETVQKQVEVSPETLKMRFINSHGGIPNAIVAASILAQDTIIRMILTSPDGTVYGPDGAGPIAGYSVDDTSEIYDIANPAPGTWTIEINGVQVPASGVEATIATYVLEQSEIDLNIPPIAEAGDLYTGTIGLPVTFYALGSWDPDGGIVQFEWDVDSDGVYDYITDDIAVTHTYQTDFAGQVTLQVTDNDGNTDTDSAEIKILGQNMSDLKLTKIADSDRVVAGEQLKYTLSVFNEGPSDAIEIELQDELPTQVILISATSTQGVCGNLRNIVTCHITALTGDESATVEIVVTTSTNTPSTITNNASVSSSTSDPNPDNNNASVTTTITPPPITNRTIFVSSSLNVKVSGIKFQDEDILYFDPNAAAPSVWKMYFDGSDVGIGKTDVDGFEVINEGAYGAVLISFDKPIQIPGMAKVDDSDIVKFTFTAPPGNRTVGFFSLCFDGSAFDLTASGENIDAIAFDAQGRLLISTDGTAKLNGSALSAKDEDLLAFSQAPFSCNPSSGSWSIFVDGSNLALTNGDEDIGGAWVDTSTPKGDVYMSTKGKFLAKSSVNATGGDSDDIFTLIPSKTGENNTDGFLAAFFDGDPAGLTKSIDGICLLPAGSTFVVSTATADPDDETMVEQYEVDSEELDLHDEELDDFDNKVEETDTELYLPFITR